MFTHSAHWILLCWAGRNFTLKRDSFIFYRSFYEAINELSVNEKAILFDAICSYSLDFKEPELSGICKTVFILIKPQLDANNKRFENGSKPKNKQNGSKQEAKPKQKVSKAEANNNENVNKNSNISKCLFINDPLFIKENFKAAFPDWTKEKLAYYYDAILTWSNEGNKKIDWKATVRTWATRDEKQGKIKFNVVNHTSQLPNAIV